MLDHALLHSVSIKENNRFSYVEFSNQRDQSLSEAS